MTAGEQIAFEPALTLVLAEHLEHSSVRREPLVSGESLRLPLSVGRGKDRVEAIRDRFIGTEESKIAPILVCDHHVTKEAPEHARVLRVVCPGRRHRDGVIAKVG